MKHLFSFLVAGFLALGVWGQSPESFDIRLEEISLSQAPGLQSFAIGQHDGKLLMIGGRTDGLHLRRPVDSFLASDNNTTVYVVDIAQNQVWSSSMATLTTAMQEQLQCTNMEFEQRDTVLYIIGGYGYSQTAGDHITHDKLTAVNIPGTIQAVMAQSSLAPHFRQISDSRMAVTGGYLGLKDDTFYLVCGQYFEGRYNPHGPTHGPGFIQQYTEEIRTFEIQDNGTTLTIANYQATKDTAELHRRDYNMTPQIFPNGERGFTIFSGVFQHTVDLPWLNTVDIRQNGYTVIPNFNQYLSQYHSANMPVYDSTGNQMHTFFFGGMSRYTLDSQGNLVDDINVPFVKTISRITRDASGALNEFKLPQEMPYFMGSSAEFVVKDGTPVYDNGVLNVNALSSGANLVGYIIGGIESSAANIFFTNTGTESVASTRIFEIWIDKSSTRRDIPVGRDRFFTVTLGPNPTQGKTTLAFEIPQPSFVSVKLWSLDGRLLEVLSEAQEETGRVELELNLGKNYPAGTYLISVDNGYERKTKKLTLQ